MLTPKFLQSSFLQFIILHSYFMILYNLDQSSAKLWDFLHFNKYFHAINQLLLELMRPVNQHLPAHWPNLWKISLTIFLPHYYPMLSRMVKWYFLKFIHYQSQSCVILHFTLYLIRYLLDWPHYLELLLLHLFVIYGFAPLRYFLAVHFKQ